MSDFPETAERVLLAMAPGRDRCLVEEWLGTATAYTVSTLSEEGPCPLAYDICLLDRISLDRHGDRLRRERSDSESYLPHLLLLTESEHDEIEHSISAADEFLVDDTLELPLSEGSFARRVETHLRTRHASIELADQADQYRELMELTPEAVLLVDDERIVSANAAAVDLFAAAETELRGEFVSRVADETDAGRLSTLLGSIPPPGEGASEFVDLGLRSVDGRRIDTSVAGIRITYGDAEVIQLLIQDRTESRRREERLRLFSRAVEASANGITIVDVNAEDQPLIYANVGFTRMTGYPFGEILGRNCRLLQGENTDPSTVETVRAAIANGEPASVEILNYRKDGTPFWNRLDIVPIHDVSGGLTHYLGLQRDITDQVQNEQRLAVLDRILRHNVRNKTNVIRGYAETIVEGVTDPAMAAERIVDASEELYTISEQVRAFDSVVRNTEESSNVIELDVIIGEGVTALREEFREADVLFRASGAVSIRAHATLRAALQDLIYQLGATEQPVAEITLIREGDDVRLDVRDCGGVIPREDLELVSTRSETPLEHLQGLELWLLRWAVEQSDGEFSVQDADGDPLIRMRFPAADREVRDS
ncbi:MAG: PAS domain-containing protein [Halolamina sp.]